jgi:hypothetical protein
MKRMSQHVIDPEYPPSEPTPEAIGEILEHIRNRFRLKFQSGPAPLSPVSRNEKDDQETAASLLD